MSFIKKLLQTGIKDEYSDTLKRHIEIANFIALVYIVVTIPFLILQRAHPNVMLVRSMPIWAAITVWVLFKLNYHKLGRLVVSLSYPIMIYIMGVLLLIDDGTNGMAPKFWFIGSAAIPFLVFDYKEKGYIIFAVIFDVLLYLTFDAVNARFDLPDLTTNLDSPQMRRMAGLGAIAMIAGVTFYVKKQLYLRNEQLAQQALDLAHKNKELTAAEEELKQNFEELSVLNEQLNLQKETIEKVLNDIRSSIRYAKSIQKSILQPQQQILKRHFNNFFIFYQPKDEIGGDFYYFYERENKLILTLADSTGHGIPGALMSVLGIALLNEAFLDADMTRPSKVLARISQRVVDYLHQNETMVRDGYDMAIACFDTNQNILNFSAAHMSLFIVREGKVTEYKGNRLPVGQFHLKQNFTDSEIQVQPGDILYSFTDGYIDQFGGKDYKKFGKKNLISLLEKISSFSLEEQGKILEQVFLDWKGKNKQTDDVTFIAIKM